MSSFINLNAAPPVLPLPHPQNELQADVLVLRQAITQIAQILATKANAQDVTAEFGQLIGAAPEAMNTLIELVQALGNDPNFATTVALRIDAVEAAYASNATGIGNIARKERAKRIFGYDF